MRKCFQTLKLGFQGWKLEFLRMETKVSNIETQYFNKMRKDNVTMLKIK